MNRGICYFGVAVALPGVALVALPMALTHHETLSLAPLAGLVLIPLGLVVVGIGAASFDPRLTTVHTAFSDDEPVRARAAVSAAAAARTLNPRAPVRCARCRTFLTPDLLRCPRCAEDRPCRNCGRSLSNLDDTVSCRSCLRAEPFCNCPVATTGPYRVGVGYTARTR